MTKTKGLLFTAGLVFAMAFTFSCDSGGGSSSSDGNSVSYQGKIYKTVVIGTQTWFAENLNYNVAGSKCYGEGGEVIIGYDDDDNPITTTLSPSEVRANCEKYGRLYDWTTAMKIDAVYNSILYGGSDVSHQGICPEGWHLPSNDDWDELFLFVDAENGGKGTNYPPYNSKTAGNYLKAADGWNWNDYDEVSGNGTDKYGFKALPGGFGYSVGSFSRVGKNDGWWSASEYESDSGLAYSRYMSYLGEYAYWEDTVKSSLFSVRCLQD